jgi:hypothetical protein
MSFEISTPGHDTFRVYCEKLAANGGTVDVDSVTAVCSIVGISIDEDGITLNDEEECKDGITYAVSQVILIPVEATTGITEQTGTFSTTWESEDGVTELTYKTPITVFSGIPTYKPTQ